MAWCGFIERSIRLNVGKDPEGPIELYDLSTDIHEDRNEADEHPEIVREIAEIMRTARIPSPLFNFGQANGAMSGPPRLLTN